VEVLPRLYDSKDTTMLSDYELLNHVSMSLMLRAFRYCFSFLERMVEESETRVKKYRLLGSCIHFLLFSLYVAGSRATYSGVDSRQLQE